MAYADYAFYSTTYLGKLSEPDFLRLAERASEYIDSRTDYQFQAAIPSELQVRVKKACCAVAEALYASSESGGSGIKASESVDGYSVQYAVNSSKVKSADETVLAAFNMYLSNVSKAVRWI